MSHKTNQFMHSFEVNIRLYQPSKVMCTSATSSGWQILILTSKECISCILIPYLLHEVIKHFWLSNAFSPVTKANQIEPVLRELYPGHVNYRSTSWTVLLKYELGNKHLYTIPFWATVKTISPSVLWTTFGLRRQFHSTSVLIEIWLSPRKVWSSCLMSPRTLKYKFSSSYIWNDRCI